ncbi:hypothetical protein D1818_15130 [Aquimarina sp. BL5]|uniref:hypothetical protein n=1 Tax=Aquimarina sp. BL5 TaxID=1714860 RepID=UPI000E50F993|nr:hypothetical protein [Aquimarina sp. BL5]AXT52107.1 hypothetical protein D1818_15130 [Aquimarina sp. BL5]RKN10763.1 hypothetical protein D7036_01795 [Aquimarina sp. BL5]
MKKLFFLLPSLIILSFCTDIKKNTIIEQTNKKRIEKLKILYYGPYKKKVFINYLVQIENENLIKYTNNLNEFTISKSFQDSFVIPNELKKINEIEFSEYDSIVWDSTSNTIVRNIFFTNNYEEKKLRIIGYPNSLKNDPILDFTDGILNQVIKNDSLSPAPQRVIK